MKQRLPRPKGLTLLSQQYNTNKDTKSKDNLLRHLVFQYTISGFTINNKSVNLEELSTLTNVPTITLFKYVAKVSQGMSGLTNQEAAGDTVRALGGMAINWALSDKGLITQQLALLLRSQGDGYKAFISGEVMKGIQTSLKANENLMKVIGTMTGGAGTTININQDNSQQTTEQYLNVTDAVALIKAERPSSDEALVAHKEGLYLEHDLSSMPEILATGVDENTMNFASKRIEEEPRKDMEQGTPMPKLEQPQTIIEADIIEEE